MLCYPKMQSMSRHLLPFLLILLSALHLAICETGTVGINYGRMADNLPAPSQVVQLLKAQGITRVKLYDTDSSVLSVFSGSNISLTVAIPNDQLSSASASQSYTDTWVQSNILSYHPKTQIEAIAVGNEVFQNSQNTPYLVPAMKNVYASLTKYGVASSIKVVSPIALSALQNSYPPSSGSFKSGLIEPVIKPMLNFLKQTGSTLMANVYPFFAYESDPKSISLDYALFRAKSGNPDPNNNLVYNSLFDAQIDAVYAAMNAIGFKDMKLVVSETGWPSKGGDTETGAGVENAAAYNGNLVRRVLTGSGTPLRPNEPIDAYLFALFNENQKTGPTSENNYGLFYPNEQKVYDVPLTFEDLRMSNGSKGQVVAPPVSGGVGGGGGRGETWCVASEGVGEEKLQEALDYACGEGGADCRPIQPGATCYDPITLVAHASYAFNSYYQMHSRGSGTCYFGGAAYVVTQNPNTGSCKYPTRN